MIYSLFIPIIYIQSSSSEASLLLNAYFLNLSFSLNLSAWSFLSYLFMFEISKVTPLLTFETWFSFNLLFLIYSIKSARFDPILVLLFANGGGAMRRGGGGGKLLSLVFLISYIYTFYSSSAYFIFLCKFVSWLIYACVFTCWRIVSSAIKFAIYLLFKSYCVRLRESNIYCHSGGILSVLNLPVLRSNAITFWNDRTCPDFFYGYGYSENIPLILLKKPPSFFFCFSASNLYNLMA